MEAYFYRGFIALAIMWIIFLVVHFVSLYPIVYLNISLISAGVLALIMALGWFIKDVMKI